MIVGRCLFAEKGEAFVRRGGTHSQCPGAAMTDEDLRCVLDTPDTNATLLLVWDCSPVVGSDVAQQLQSFLGCCHVRLLFGADLCG